MTCPKCQGPTFVIKTEPTSTGGKMRLRRCDRHGRFWTRSAEKLDHWLPATAIESAGNGNLTAIADKSPLGDLGGLPLDISSQPLSPDLDSDSSLLGKPRARRGRPATKGYTSGFLRFWDEIRPRCGNKEPAFKAWVKFECEKLGVDFIVEQFMLRASTSKWKRGYAQNVSTWLNEKGWETEPDPSEYDNGVPEKIRQSRDSARTWAHRSVG